MDSDSALLVLSFFKELLNNFWLRSRSIDEEEFNVLEAFLDESLED